MFIIESKSTSQLNQSTFRLVASLCQQERHWMTIKRHFVLGVFFGALAAPYCLWLIASIDKPLWIDELITVALVKSGSLKHMLSAILMGLDDTPPLYTGYGWLMWHYVTPQTSPACLLRITNAGLTGATLWILYLLVRRYFDRLTALMTICAFILLEHFQLGFLTLDVRTYAALVFFTTLAIYASVRAVERPSLASLTCMMLAYFLLLWCHIFGIMYVISIAVCTIVAAAERDFKLVLKIGLATAPTIVVFVLWVPILRSISQFGTWEKPPNLPLLLGSTYLPMNKWMVALLLLAAPTLGWRLTRIPRMPAPMKGWRALNRVQRFVVLLPIAFGASTAAVWIFSRFIFPVFLPRYFYPNIILHVIWVSVFLNSTFSYVKPSMMKYGLALVFAVITGLTTRYRQLNLQEENLIPCFDLLHRTYLEDPFEGNGIIVTQTTDQWMTRQGRLGETVVFPIDEDALKRKGNGEYAFLAGWVTRFAEWAGVRGVMTTSQLLEIKPDIMVLDNDWGEQWLNYIQLTHQVKLTPLAKMNGCTLWQMETLR